MGINISETNKSIILQEFDFALGKMEKSNSVTEKLYFYSAIHGVIHRIVNIEYDTELLFVNFILKISYDVIHHSTSGNSGQMNLIVPELFDNIEKQVKKLRNNIEKGEDVYKTLEAISILTYTATGNGYYLTQRGTIKLD